MLKWLLALELRVIVGVLIALMISALYAINRALPEALPLSACLLLLAMFFAPRKALWQVFLAYTLGGVALVG